jgi:hypothetical protein
VVVEHAYGALKCRWTSLCGLRLSISNRRDEIRVTAWIRACVVLHNLLIASADDWDDYEKPELEPDPASMDLEETTGGRTVLASRHHPRRVKVMLAMGLDRPSGPMRLTRQPATQPTVSRSMPAELR